MSQLAERKTVKGQTLACLICGNDTFFERSAQLNTRGLTFLKLDWANKVADCYVCENCGYIHWFLQK